MPSGDMDDHYNVGISNKFDHISSDLYDDPSDLIRAAQEKPKKDKEPKVKGKKEVKPTEKKSVKIETSTENENSEHRRNDRPRTDRGRGRGRGRGGRGGERSDRGGERGGRGRGGFRNNNFSNNNNQGGFGFDNNNQGGFGQTQVAETNEGGFGSGFGGNDGEERRGGRSGYRGGRGGRGGRGRGRGGNREFDRRSGSDKSSVKPADKRDGSGSYNWGSPQDEINAASDDNGGFGAPKETEETPAETVEQTPETEETPEVEPVDEGPQEMTLEEYRKQSESRNKPKYNLRKVESDKKGLKQLKKPTLEDNECKMSIQFPKKSSNETFKTSGRVKEALNCNIHYGGSENRLYDTSRRTRGGRGGRRGGRRDGEGNAKDTGYALTKEDDFPSLRN